MYPVTTAWLQWVWVASYWSTVVIAQQICQNRLKPPLSLYEDIAVSYNLQGFVYVQDSYIHTLPNSTD